MSFTITTNSCSFNLEHILIFFDHLQTESRQMEYQMNEISFLIALAWAEGDIDVGDLMLKIEKSCEGVRHRNQKINCVHLTFHLS